MCRCEPGRFRGVQQALRAARLDRDAAPPEARATAGDVTLVQAGNNVVTFSAVNAALDADVRYRDADGVTIGSVSDDPLDNTLFAATTGVSVNDARFTLNAGGAVQIDNISTTGLCLRTPQRVRPGSVLVLTLPDVARGPSRPLPVRIIHSTRQPEGHWLSGGAFVRRLSEPELEAILAAGRPPGHRSEP